MLHFTRPCLVRRVTAIGLVMVVLISACGQTADRRDFAGANVPLPAGGIDVVSLADRQQVVSPPVDYVFVGSLPAAPAPDAPAWWAPVEIPDLERFSSIARGFGLSAPPRTAAADRCAEIDPTTTAQRPPCTYDGPWVIAGKPDATGSAATMSLDTGGNWFYSPPGSAPGGVGCAGVQDPLPNQAAGVTTFPREASSTSVVPCPTLDETVARTKAEQLMSKLGMATSDYVVSTRTDRNGISVVADRLLGDVASGVKFVVGFSADGTVRYAFGSLRRLQAAGRLTIVSPDVALRRLNDHSGSWQFPPTVFDGPFVPGLGDDSSPLVLTLTGTPADAVAYTTAPGTAPVALIGVRVGLRAVTVRDGSTWLLPAYDFTAVDGGHQLVLAVDESAFGRPPTAPTLPSTTEPSTDANP